ncbi:carbohydrate ABC transporter permease [Cohnella cholangitidis]|uniref:Sugar ABC transporter permease n=1 Tax=Cohnella cholangitidis TaxID=2598458 RepID=A0A7G5C763_9BACL|nr:sugar ABC transporter permease [Cohnella cholangitidis]QMV45047.1 sugar ABC transporter permease [Cohnella cholangitidis]
MSTAKRYLRSWLTRPERAAYLFLLPSALILTVFIVIPLVATLVISMLNMDVFLKSADFAGADHFRQLLDDESFWNALKNTAYFAVVEVPLQVIVSLLAAVYVANNTRFRKFLRSVFFLPAICSFTAIGIAWSFLLDPQTGLYTEYLFNLGLPRIAFLRDPHWAMPTVILTTVWKTFGYSMMLLVAGLQNIPNSYYEAAEIDGAGSLRKFVSVTLPMLIPALSFTIITTTIGALQVFDQVFVMTHGGPLNKTETIVSYIYNVGFSMAPYDLGYASAISVALFVLIMIITLSMNRFFTNKETSM